MSDPNADVEALLEALASGYESILQTNWTQLSALIIILYDYILTFDQEVHFMWRGNWSSGKILFFAIRYFTLGSMLFATLYMFRTTYTNESCLAWARLQWIGGTIIVVLTEVVLQLRIYALYMRSKKILALLVSASVVTIVATCVVIAKIMQLETVDLNPFPGFSYETCLDIILPSFFPAYWIPVLGCEVLLFSLALGKGVQVLRDRHRGASPGRMTMYLLKDSMLYFTVVFAIFFVNEVVWWTGGVRLMEIPVGFAFALCAVMSSRLLLNIRENWSATPSSSEAHSTDYGYSGTDRSLSSGIAASKLDREIPLTTFHVRSTRGSRVGLGSKS